jgi:hypothetical protein
MEPTNDSSQRIEASEFKKCCVCRILRPLTKFHKNNTNNDGLQAIWSQCKTEIYLKNKEKLFPKVNCSCGKTIYKYYLVIHLKTKLHISRLQVIIA